MVKLNTSKHTWPALSAATVDPIGGPDEQQALQIPAARSLEAAGYGKHRAGYYTYTACMKEGRPGPMKQHSHDID